MCKLPRLKKPIIKINGRTKNGLPVYISAENTCKRCGKIYGWGNFGIAHITLNETLNKYVAYQHSYCRKCSRILNKEYREKNAEYYNSKEFKERAKKRVRRQFFHYKALWFRSRYGVWNNTKPKELALIFWLKWKNQKGCCAITGRKLMRDNAEPDHIMPRSLGVNNHPDNIQWVIRKANHAKNNMTEEEFDQFIIDIYNHRKLTNKCLT